MRFQPAAALLMTLLAPWRSAFTLQETVARAEGALSRQGGDSLGCIEIASEPAGASVFLGEIRFGVTPLFLRHAPSDSLQVTVVKQFYEPWKSTLRLAISDTVRINARLRKLETALSILVEDSSAVISIDGRTVGSGSVHDVQVQPGDHRISIADSVSLRSVSTSVTLGEGEKVTYRGGLGRRSVWRLAGSLVLPGYAPVADGAYIKGVGILALSAAAVVYSLGAVQAYEDRLAQYNQAVARYGAALTEQDAIAARTIMVQKHDDLDRGYRARTVSYLFLGGVYALNVIDTIMNHMLVDELRFVPTADTRFVADAAWPVGIRIELVIR
jgi:hypothetical protein